jgi:hypothetical protein
MELTFHIRAVEFTAGAHIAPTPIGVSAAIEFDWRHPWSLVFQFQPLLPFQFEVEIGKRL